MKTHSIPYTCKSCDHEFNVEVEPIRPARLFGPPENCHPSEGGDYEPSECPECGHDLDEGTIYSAYEEAVIDAQADYADHKRDIDEDR